MEQIIFVDVFIQMDSVSQAGVFCKVLHSTQGVNMAEILRLQSKNPKKLVCLPEASQLVVLKIYFGLFGSSLVLLPRYTEKKHGIPYFP